MTTDGGALTRLGESAETVANADEDIRGRLVKDRDGEELGKVKDLLVDRSHRVRFIEIASGGFLGIGQERTFLPVDAITAITDDEVRVDQTRDHVAAAPAYDPELIRERETYDAVLGYYGFGPFWAADYQYPNYPYYR